MISGTDFRFETPQMIADVCQGLRPGLAMPSDVLEIQAECEADRALCLGCEDGVVVVSLQPGPEGLELFVLLAVALRRGAVSRQGPALDKIGRDLGAKTVAFHTRRRGWARALGPEWRRRGTLEFVRGIT